MEIVHTTTLPALYVPRLEQVIKATKLHPSKIHNVYVFGSRVYETHTDESDWDFIIVANNSVEAIEIKDPFTNFNIHIYTPDRFKKDLDWQRINNLECIYAPKWAKLKEDINYDDHVIDLKKLRHACSHISSNSWVKCKKKLELGEYNIGIKSFFHSIRIPMFATQLAREGTLNNFKCANFIWNRLAVSNVREWNWDSLNKEFRVTYNLMLSQFRSVTTK